MDGDGSYTPAESSTAWPEWQPMRSRAHPLHMRISERRILLMVGDVAATVVSVLLALRVWTWQAHAPFTAYFIERHAYWFIILPLLWVLLANVNDYYNLRVAAHLPASAKRLVAIMGQLLILYGATFFLSPRNSLPRIFIVYYAVISVVLTGAWRMGRLFLIGWTGFRRRALIVGSGPAADLIIHAIKQEAHADYEIIGAVLATADPAVPPPQVPLLGRGSDLPAVVRDYDIAELVLAYVNEIPADIFQGTMACYEQGMVIVPMPLLYEQITGRIPVEEVGEHLWALVLPMHRYTMASALYRAIKRVMDVAFALVGLALCALLLPPLLLAIHLDSRGPAFFRQRRVGRGGRLFTVYKLRTMVVNAERTTGAQWARRDDPRITRVGRFLRRTRLDELPQLLNILRGEMSLVGPRPERPEFVKTLAADIAFYRSRLAVTPGLTGWAQVRYRYGNSFEDTVYKLQYDLYYIRHQSLGLDLLIMLKTVGTMLAFRGT
ncbi:MAG TPA: sugar transferase [Ktedonobacterales bacterium]